ncbi:hypothetical protein D9M70_638810 [compost metagenome]
MLCLNLVQFAGHQLQAIGQFGVHSGQRTRLQLVTHTGGVGGVAQQGQLLAQLRDHARGFLVRVFAGAAGFPARALAGAG